VDRKQNISWKNKLSRCYDLLSKGFDDSNAINLEAY